MLIKTTSAAAGLNKGSVVPVKCRRCGRQLKKMKSLEMCPKCISKFGGKKDGR